MKAWQPGEGGKCFVSDTEHPNYLAGRRATKMVYGVEPDLTRSGGSIPVTLTLQEATGKNVILLPILEGQLMTFSPKLERRRFQHVKPLSQLLRKTFLLNFF